MISRNSSPPRILIVGPTPPPHIGPAFATRRLVDSPYLRERFQVDLFDISDRDGFDGIGTLDWNNVSLALRHGAGFLKALLTRRPDVVYVSIARGFWGFLRDTTFLAPARALGIPVVAHLRAGRFDIMHDNGAVGRLVGRAGMRMVERGVVLAEPLRELFSGMIPSGKIRVVTNGLPLDPYVQPAERPSGSRFTIAYMSNLFRDKGIHVMIAAIPEIRVSAPDLLVRFAGQWIDPRYEQECRALVDSLGVAGNVEFLSPVTGQAKKAFLEGSDLVAFVPVKPEGLPWVVLEAMAAARPVIGTPQGAMREVIVDGVTGILVEPGNPGRLAEAVRSLILDRDRMRRMGSAGRARVEARYSEEAAHRDLAELFLEVVQR